MTGLSRSAVVVVFAVAASGCSLVYRDGRYGGNNWDGGFDAGPTIDAPLPDGGHDGGRDAGAPDAGMPDSGPSDAGPADSGTTDAPSEDAT